MAYVVFRTQFSAGGLRRLLLPLAAAVALFAHRAASVVGPLDAPTLLGVAAIEVGEGSLIYLHARGSPTAELSTLEDPPRLVIDLPRAADESGSETIEVGSPRVSRIRIGRHADRVRVVLDGGQVARPFQFHRLAQAPEGLVLALGTGEALERALARARTGGWSAATEPARPAGAGPVRTAALLGIEDVELDGSSLIHLRAEGLRDFESFTLADPERLVIDLPHAQSRVGTRTLALASPRASRVRIGQHGDRLRVVIDSGRVARPFEGHRAIPTASGLVVALGTGEPLERAVELVRTSGWGAALARPEPVVVARAPPGPRLLAIDAIEVGEGSLIHFDAPGVTRFDSFTIADPERLVIDLPGAVSELTGETIAIGSRHISQARVGEHPDRVRVVLDAGPLKEPFRDRRVLETPGGLLIALGSGGRLEAVLATARSAGWDAALELAAARVGPAPEPAPRIAEAEPPPEPGPAPEPAPTPSPPAPRPAPAPEEPPAPRPAETVGRPQDLGVQRAERELLATQSGVLLPAGQLVLEPGFSYTNLARGRLQLEGVSLLPGITIGRIESADIDRDIYTPFLVSRYGIHDRLEFQLDVPYFFRVDSEISGASGSERQRVVSGDGIGDISAALFAHIFRESGWIPDVILNARGRAPTGRDPFEISLDSMGRPSELPVGSGFWGASAGIGLVKTIDPVVLFGSANYRWNLPRTVTGVGRIEPGNTFEYDLGLAFGINERTALGFSLQQAITPETELNGLKLLRTNVNAATFFLGGSFIINQYLGSALNVGLGLNDQASDFTVEVRFPIRVPFLGPAFK